MTSRFGKPAFGTGAKLGGVGGTGTAGTVGTTGGFGGGFARAGTVGVGANTGLGTGMSRFGTVGANAPKTGFGARTGTTGLGAGTGAVGAAGGTGTGFGGLARAGTTATTGFGSRFGATQQTAVGAGAAQAGQPQQLMDNTLEVQFQPFMFQIPNEEAVTRMHHICADPRFRTNILELRWNDYQLANGQQPQSRLQQQPQSRFGIKPLGSGLGAGAAAGAGTGLGATTSTGFGRFGAGATGTQTTTGRFGTLGAGAAGATAGTGLGSKFGTGLGAGTTGGLGLKSTTTSGFKLGGGTGLGAGTGTGTGLKLGGLGAGTSGTGTGLKLGGLGAGTTGTGTGLKLGGGLGTGLKTGLGTTSTGTGLGGGLKLGATGSTGLGSGLKLGTTGTAPRFGLGAGLGAGTAGTGAAANAAAAGAATTATGVVTPAVPGAAGSVLDNTVVDVFGLAPLLSTATNEARSVVPLPASNALARVRNLGSLGGGTTTSGISSATTAPVIVPTPAIGPDVMNSTSTGLILNTGDAAVNAAGAVAANFTRALGLGPNELPPAFVATSGVGSSTGLIASAAAAATAAPPLSLASRVAQSPDTALPKGLFSFSKLGPRATPPLLTDGSEPEDTAAKKHLDVYDSARNTGVSAAIAGAGFGRVRADMLRSRFALNSRAADLATDTVTLRPALTSWANVENATSTENRAGQGVDVWQLHQQGQLNEEKQDELINKELDARIEMHLNQVLGRQQSSSVSRRDEAVRAGASSSANAAETPAPKSSTASARAKTPLIEEGNENLDEESDSAVPSGKVPTFHRMKSDAVQVDSDDEIYPDSMAEEQRKVREAVEKQKTEEAAKAAAAAKEAAAAAAAAASAVSIQNQPRVSNSNSHNYTPTLENKRIRTSPSIEELSKMSYEELRAVPDFEVEHPTYGKVKWLVPIDLTYVSLDSVIHFARNIVDVYGESSVELPKDGEKLNNPAEIHVYSCFPDIPETLDADEIVQPNSELSQDEQIDIAAFDYARKNASPEDLEQYEELLRETSANLSAEFVKYDRNTGEWVMRVSGFF